MPSSPEATISTWQPADFAAPAPPGAGPIAERPVLFEVSRTSCVPAALLDPERAAARSAGYAAGWAKGIEAARLVGASEARATLARAEQDAAHERAAIAQALDALDTARSRLEQRSAPVLAELEQLIVSTAYAIAEAVVGATVRDDVERGTYAVRRALSLTPRDTDVTVALHPADLQALRERSGDPGPHVRLEADASLTPGDAIATSGATEIDARVTAALGRVREALAL